MRGIATLLCALSLSAAGGCCGGCGPCGRGGYPTAAAAPNYNGGATYADTNTGAPSEDVAGAEGAQPGSSGSSVAPASYDAPTTSQPSVEMQDDTASDRTVRRKLPAYTD